MKHEHLLRAVMLDHGNLQFEIMGENPEILLREFINAAQRKYQCNGGNGHE